MLVQLLVIRNFAVIFAIKLSVYSCRRKKKKKAELSTSVDLVVCFPNNLLTELL